MTRISELKVTTDSCCFHLHKLNRPFDRHNIHVEPHSLHVDNHEETY